VKLLAINDFHGRMIDSQRVGSRRAGGAAVLASWLRAAQAGMEDATLLVHAGDHVGASPPESALLQDEPAVAFLNLLADAACSAEDRLDPDCNLVGAAGNHEFDEGRAELERLLGGGNHPAGPFLEDPWGGARYPTLAANVVDAATGKPILPPYVVKRVRGMPVAFVGAVLEGTPLIVSAEGVAGLRFLDEADAVNAQLPELRRQHVRAVVVVLHQGTRQSPSFTGPTPGEVDLGAEIGDIVSRLDDEVDVVVSGHAHSFTNAIRRNRSGKEILVTQAFSYGTAYGDIDLWIDPASKDVVQKSASIVTTWTDEGPGLAPSSDAAALAGAAQARVAPLVNRVVATATADVTRAQSAAGESALGNLIADAQRAAMGTDFAFMNPGGIRDDIPAGPVTWGKLFNVQPFGNSLVAMTLTGAQVRALLERQWQVNRVLQISGLTYRWDASRAVGDRVVELRKDGAPIDPATAYRVVVNSFLAGGGDGFSVLAEGTELAGGPVDLDALVAHLERLGSFASAIEGRIARVN
jgi:5'-nucleotidase